MKKKITVILLIVLIITITTAVLYQTFAMDTIIEESYEDSHLIGLKSLDTKTATVPAHDSKTIIYKIHNTNNGRVRYAVGYNTNSSVAVKIYNNSEDLEEGVINANEYRYVKLYLENSSSANYNITISTILGYEGGGDFIVPSGISLVSEVYIQPENMAKMITDLYNSASKAEVINNNITYNYASSFNLMNDRLGGTTESLDSGNIRYYGADPNNYLYFNCSDYNNQTSSTCELWRIIGVFGNRVKIIRNDSIGEYVYDDYSDSINDWSRSEAMKLLNDGYEDENFGGSLYYNAASGSCYVGRNAEVAACDFTSTGLKNDQTRSLIDQVTWSLGGIDLTNIEIYSDQAYQYERGDIVYPNSGNPTTWSGQIAFIYPSDYGYAADFSSCSQNLRNYSDSSCRYNNWLNNGADQWLLTPNTTSSIFVNQVFYTGVVMRATSYDTYNIRPTLYLKSSSTVISGTGTSSDPYRLKGTNL